MAQIGFNLTPAPLEGEQENRLNVSQQIHNYTGLLSCFGLSERIAKQQNVRSIVQTQ